MLAVLLLTLAATGALIFKIPATLTGLPTSFFLLGAFVVFFVMAGVWLARKFNPQALKTGAKLGGDMTTPADLAVILPACSAVLPFLLLIMTTQRLALVDPSPVFGLALLLAVLLLGITKLFSMDWMPAIGLVCVTALECAWHFNRFDVANPAQPLNTILAWYLIFFAAFALFPFLFLRKFTDKVVPWAAAAMAGPAQFFLIHRFMKAAHPNPEMGLLPAAFAIPALVSLIVVLKQIPAAGKARITQLAWFGGVALFFITLIFPRIQFDRQWITIGWALEGRRAAVGSSTACLHPGSEARPARAFSQPRSCGLALNPAVLDCTRPQRDPDSQLVSLRLRDRDPMPVRRRPAHGPATQYHPEIGRPADPRRPRDRPGVSAAQHRNLGLLQRTGLDAHLRVQRQFRPRHDLLDRLGAILTRATDRRHGQAATAGALCGDGIALRDAAQAVLP